MSKTLYPFSVGNFRCFTFSDGMLYGNAERFFVGPTDEERAEALKKAVIEPDKVPSYFTPVFIDTGTHKVLIDTGIGVVDDPDYGFLLENLSSINVQPDDIDIVVNTHAHSDHISANVDERNLPRFTNARYIIHQAEWD